MKPSVYYISVSGAGDDISLSRRVADVLTEKNCLDFAAKDDFIAVKTHFGETEKSGFVRPVHLAAIGRLIKEKGARPFLTETSTLYRGSRTNAVDHIMHADAQGFSTAHTGMPVIMLDGLFGDEETEVKIKGRLHTSVKVGALLRKIQGLVVVSHFTGHLAAGFGAAVKNLGMGCTSRKAKLLQHSTVKPSVKKQRCTGCGLCVTWCPAGAVQLADAGTQKTPGAMYASIDKKGCIGCGQCLAMCRYDAISYNWGADAVSLQKNIAEHALGVHGLMSGRVLYVTYLTRISKDCDCMHSYKQVAPDIGVLISEDPVAIDSAAVDLVERAVEKKISDIAFDIPYRFQIDYAAELGMGSREYELVEV